MAIYHLDLPALPGCNSEQYGPAPVVMVPNCNAVSTTLASGPTPA